MVSSGKGSEEEGLHSFFLSYSTRQGLQLRTNPLLFSSRIIDILPNKFQGIVGEHEDFPIECIKLSHDKTYLASCSHDDTVRFWDVRHLTSNREEGEDDSEEAQEVTGDNQKDSEDEKEPIEEQSGEMDVDSDDSDAPKKNNRRPKKAAPAANNPGFFDDL